jgi:hypothetical protein
MKFLTAKRGCINNALSLERQLSLVTGVFGPEDWWLPPGWTQSQLGPALTGMGVLVTRGPKFIIYNFHHQGEQGQTHGAEGSCPRSHSRHAVPGCTGREVTFRVRSGTLAHSYGKGLRVPRGIGVTSHTSLCPGSQAAPCRTEGSQSSNCPHVAAVRTEVSAASSPSLQGGRHPAE